MKIKPDVKDVGYVGVDILSLFLMDERRRAGYLGCPVSHLTPVSTKLRAATDQAGFIETLSDCTLTSVFATFRHGILLCMMLASFGKLSRVARQ